MNAEIITIGDELITGHTVDTNAAFIAQKLTDVGVAVQYRTSVGDNMDTMLEAFQLALRRARIVITTGGLGPTNDDITKKAIVKLFRRNLVFHEEVLTDLKTRFDKRGIRMPAINQNQALLPQGAEFFPNRIGTALGICIVEGGRAFIALPGVPFEAEQIMTDSVVPYVRGMRGGMALKIAKVRTTGISESKMTEKIGPGLKIPAGVRLAYLPSYSGVDLRVISEGETDDEAATKAQSLIRHLESTCEKYIYGYDDDTLESVVGQLLVDNDKTVTVAESCTAGQLGMTFTSVAGSSDYFLGGMTAYANDVKINQLGVEESVIDEYGAVSDVCAVAMATACRKLFTSDYALAITGIAGPGGGTDEKPVGTTYVAIASAQGSKAKLFKLGPKREVNRTRACYAALEMLRREILDIR